ncbi:MAG: fimbria/pilus periplasmic chaperone [Archangium sp.]
MRTLLALALAVLPRFAFAVDFDVSPVRLDLSASARTGHLTVRNPGAQPLRLQISARGWQQASDGRIELEPTSEVSFFPSLFELAPGQTRIIRIGVSATETPREKTFRVLIDELPQQHAGLGVIQVVTRLSVPVFFGAPGKPQPEIVGTRLESGAVAFELKNSGSAHFVARRAVVVARDAKGGEVATGEQAGWYVLAGGDRRFVVPLSAAAAGAVRVGVRVETDVGLAEAEVRVP